MEPRNIKLFLESLRDPQFHTIKSSQNELFIVKDFRR